MTSYTVIHNTAAQVHVISEGQTETKKLLTLDTTEAAVELVKLLAEQSGMKLAVSPNGQLAVATRS